MSAPGSWDGGAPPPVIPRPAPSRRGPNIGVIAAVVLAVAAVAAAVAFMLLRPSGDSAAPAVSAPPPSSQSAAGQPANDPNSRLLHVLPAGYPAGACTPVARLEGALATVACTANADQGGPVSATYSLLVDSAALAKAITEVANTSTVVDCPGRIQSPGPWRHNASPQEVSGTLVCGIQGDNPMLAWSDIDKQLFSVVQGRPGGPTLDHLYAWWTSHS
ncbi:MAG: hypothetical protein ACRDUB_07580 [Mycobacterium sp.]